MGDVPTTRLPRADARRNVERIVATAREAFTEGGIDVPLDTIARRAGVGPGTLYRHFRGREALLEAVYRSDIEHLSNRAHELSAERSPEEALREWVGEQVRYVIHRRGLTAAIKASLDHDSETFAYCKDLMRKAAETVLAPAQEAGVVRDSLEPRDLLLLAHGVGTVAEAAPDAVDRLLTVMLDGLRPSVE